MAVNRELGFLTELLVSGNMSTVVDNCINASYLTGRYKKAFRFIQEHQSNYGKIPTIETFLEKNKGINLVEHNGEIGTGENIKYWCDELRTKKKHNTMADSLESVMELMNEDVDTEGAYDFLKKLVLNVESQIIQSDRIKLSDSEIRWEDYKKRQRSGGITGIPTGIEMFDKITGGLNKGELTTLMAYTGVGKTWWEVIVAVALAKAGYRVLFITTEMSTKALYRRIDAVWNSLNYTRFRRGQLMPDEEKRFSKYIEEMKEIEEEDELLTVEQATGGISQISAKIDQYNPDVILIDGGYLLEDEEGDEDNWMGMVRIWRGLHRLCLLKDKPIVVSTQSKDEEGATLKSVNFARAIAQDCDVFCVLEQDEQEKNDREATIRFLKLREGEILSRIKMNWDFDKMDYSCIYQENSVEETQVDNVQGVITIE